ncbi:hypothetical protein [Pareuzebyella sediminis]|uniref:hypothetical protein n=1 Tax=Pareuzebyella sediminis TaxID=2607998 RepID=UPI0011EF5D49|nr:hypothetical protein [Pareuzebyella sediminis]
MLRYFLENAYVPLYGITFLLSLYRYSKYFDTKLKYLPIIFIYTFLNEMLGSLIFEYPEYRFFGSDALAFYNMVIYNIYNVIFCLYFFRIYTFYLDNEKIKIGIQYASIAFLIVATLNPFYEDFVTSSQTATYVVGGLIILVCSTLYLRQIFTTKNEIPWKNDLLFWISLGLFVFYAGYLPIKILRFYHSIYNITEGTHVRLTHLSLIVIMYLLIIIGFLRMRRRLPR